MVELLNPSSRFIRVGAPTLPAQSMFYFSVEGSAKVNPRFHQVANTEVGTDKQDKSGSNGPSESAKKSACHKATPVQGFSFTTTIESSLEIQPNYSRLVTEYRPDILHPPIFS